MTKRLGSLTLIFAAGLCLVVAVGTSSASAATALTKFTNRSSSRHWISVYSGASCSGTRHSVAPGHSASGKSYKVGYVSMYSYQYGARLSDTGHMKMANECASFSTVANRSVVTFVYP